MTLKKYIARRSRGLRSFIRNWIPDSQVRALKKRARKKTKELKLVVDNIQKIATNDIILVTVGKDESIIIPHFVDYYSKLGVDHFIFVDNNSIEPIADYLNGCDNISVFSTLSSYADSLYGIDWVNFLLHKYCCNHWVLVVDLDEYLVYPDVEKTGLRSLVDTLEEMGQKAMYTPMMDMYPKGPISEAVINESKTPLDAASYFDKTGFVYGRGSKKELWLKGGPRLRLFNPSSIDDAPALNKYALVKWSKICCYSKSTHILAPLSYCSVSEATITGALLHFKFLSSFQEKTEYAVVHENHYRGSAEYKNYLTKLNENRSVSLHYQGSLKYESSDSLVSIGFMNKGHAWPEGKKFLCPSRKKPIIILLVHSVLVDVKNIHQRLKNLHGNIKYLGEPFNNERVNTDSEILDPLAISQSSIEFRNTSMAGFCDYLVSGSPQQSIFLLSYIPDRNLDLTVEFLYEHTPAVVILKNGLSPFLETSLVNTFNFKWPLKPLTGVQELGLDDLSNELLHLADAQSKNT